MISVLYFPVARIAFGTVAVALFVLLVFVIAGRYVAAHDRGYWKGWSDRADPVERKRDA